jgi:cysteine desulfurase
MIYLDHGATTAVLPEVVEAMTPYFMEYYGNPSGHYEYGETSKKAIEQVRRTIADSLGAQPEEIYFTAGGTESDNWALHGMADFHPGGHIITTQIEHHAILHTCEYLEKKGMRVTYLPVDEKGMISLDQLEDAICEETCMISVMFANNEIGTIQPIDDIGKIATKYNICFHTDAVQAYMHLRINVHDMAISMLSASAHKFGGPKGVGFLYIRKDQPIRAFMHGGSQERHMRSGTENVPGIAGMGKAVELGMKHGKEEAAYVKKLRNDTIKKLFREIPYLRLNGDFHHRLPGNINISFQFVEAQSLLVLLDMQGICASAGSACTSGDKGISHVLQAIHLREDLARGTLRFTLGADNTPEEMEELVKQLKLLVNDLRSF